MACTGVGVPTGRGGFCAVSGAGSVAGKQLARVAIMMVTKKRRWNFFIQSIIQNLVATGLRVNKKYLRSIAEVFDFSLLAQFLLERFGQGRDHREQIPNHAVARSLEDGRIGILVDGDNQLARAHPRHVLDGPGNTGRDV